MARARPRNDEFTGGLQIENKPSAVAVGLDVRVGLRRVHPSDRTQVFEIVRPVGGVRKRYIPSGGIVVVRRPNRKPRLQNERLSDTLLRRSLATHVRVLPVKL